MDLRSVRNRHARAAPAADPHTVWRWASSATSRSPRWPAGPRRLGSRTPSPARSDMPRRPWICSCAATFQRRVTTTRGGSRPRTGPNLATHTAEPNLGQIISVFRQIIGVFRQIVSVFGPAAAQSARPDHSGQRNNRPRPGLDVPLPTFSRPSPETARNAGVRWPAATARVGADRPHHCGPSASTPAPPGGSGPCRTGPALAIASSTTPTRGLPPDRRVDAGGPGTSARPRQRNPGSSATSPRRVPAARPRGLILEMSPGPHALASRRRAAPAG